MICEVVGELEVISACGNSEENVIGKSAGTSWECQGDRKGIVLIGR